MPDARSMVYWDSCVCLSYINGIEDRIPILDALLASSASDKGTIKLYSSALSRVEVAFGFIEKTSKILDREIEQRIDSLWDDQAAIVTVDYHNEIGRIARELMRNTISQGWSLKPFDAIHLAIAQWLSAVSDKTIEFHTYSKDLPRYAPLTRYAIVSPYTPQSKLF